MLDIDCLPLGDFQTNCYIVRPAGEAIVWVVDPGLNAAPLLRSLRASKFTVSRIAITHGHADHIAGVADVKHEFPKALVTAPADDVQMLRDARLNLSAAFDFPLIAPPPDQLVHAGDVLEMGSLSWQVLDTSGHTAGGVSFYCPAAGVAFVGDALFAGSVGRCDLPGSSFEQLIRNIRQQLLTLPDETRILPGHGPETTIGREKELNPFL